MPRVSPQEGRSPSLLRQVFGMPTPNDETRLVQSDSFKDLHFVGGEEEAHDYFHRKWEANRRTSLDERQREAHQRAVVAPLAAGADAAKASTTIHAAHPSSRHAAQKNFFDGAFALGGVLPAGNATLAPATAASRKASVAVPEVDSNDWY